MLHITRFTGFALSLATLTASLTILIGIASVASANIFTDEQRREYLQYYAPIIMKRSHEADSSRYGRDWITNFDFDNDQDYSTNKGNWEKVDNFVAAAGSSGSAYEDWYIGPTLYTAILEYEEGAQKNLTLQYHVYHAKEQGDVHDWERIEIRVLNADGTPGTDASTDDVIDYVVITEHSKHSRRKPGGDLNFQKDPLVSDGKHVMIWQAVTRRDGFDLKASELHFVEDSWSQVENDVSLNLPAMVDINGSPGEVLNYVFVPEFDSYAVNYWGAQELTYTLADQLAAKTSTSVNWDDVPRITYELQDLADIIPSHWSGQTCDEDGNNCTAEPVCPTSEPSEAIDPPNTDWQCDTRIPIRLDEPMRDENGNIEVPAGRHIFYRLSLDDDDPDKEGESQGYPKKHWFWGAYNFGEEHSFMTSALNSGTPGQDDVRRDTANGFTDSFGGPNHGPYMWQHDYFVHFGAKANGNGEEDGTWLLRGWELEENGGFDGRWVQLFDDPVEVPEPSTALSMVAGAGLLGILRRRRMRKPAKRASSLTGLIALPAAFLLLSSGGDASAEEPQNAAGNSWFCTVTFDEVMSIFESLNSETPDPRIDTDGDGFVSMQEFEDFANDECVLATVGAAPE